MKTMSLFFEMRNPYFLFIIQSKTKNKLHFGAQMLNDWRMNSGIFNELKGVKLIYTFDQ